MKNYYSNFRRLLCDVKNPDHDKRKRYGIESVPSLPKGTALYEFTRDPEEKYSAGTVYFHRNWTGHSESAYTSSGFGYALIHNSIVCEPETWREQVSFAVGSTRNVEGILDQLLADGTITLSQIVEAARAEDEASRAKEEAA